MRYHPVMRTALLCLLVAIPLSAFERTLDPEMLQQAIALGQSGFETRRTEFHRPYRVPVNQNPLDYIDIITPFRRVVLAAEAQLRSGQRLFGQREALAVLGDAPERLELRLELTFHPLNTYIGVPGYTITLVDGTGRSVAPQTIDRIPRFGPRVDGVPTVSATAGVGVKAGPSQPLLGGTIVAVFDGAALDPRGSYDVTVKDGNQTIAFGQVDFARLR